MPQVVQRSCPNCGAPVSTEHTVMECEFCHSPLMVVRQPPPPNPVAPVPIAVFGAVGYHAPPRRSPAALVAILVAVLMLVGMTTAFIFLAAAPRHVDPPPMPPMPVVVEPPPMPGVPTNNGSGGVTGAGMIAMFETQCTQGDAQSCITAGTLYEHGQMGVSKDMTKAKQFYDRACKLGNSSGCSLAKSAR